jgi:phosphatidylglycerophosphate synthase
MFIYNFYDDEVNMSNRTRSSLRPRTLEEQKRILSLDKDDLRFPSNTRKKIWFYFGKHIADMITLSRCFLGLFLIWSGLVDGRAVLAQDIWILVLAWSTDIVDGQISRSLKTNHKTWLGKNDVYVDMFFSVAVLVYLTGTGLVPLEITLIYLLVWGAVFWNWGIPSLLAQLFQNPIYAYFVFLTVQSAPSVLPWLLLWALISFMFFWRRFFNLLKDVRRKIVSR